MNNRIKMTDSKFKCNIILFLSVTVFMARLSINMRSYIKWKSKEAVPSPRLSAFYARNVLNIPYDYIYAGLLILNRKIYRHRMRQSVRYITKFAERNEL
jgi:hypothetical protein